MKFLIDECLSPKLTALARERGYGESTHIVWLGHAGAKDWDLIPLIVDGDWIFVTRNSVDFRGVASHPGEKGQYARVDLHAGLICLNGPEGMTREHQCPGGAGGPTTFADWSVAPGQGGGQPQRTVGGPDARATGMRSPGPSVDRRRFMLV